MVSIKLAERTCLNCMHEPKWGKWTEGEYPRCYGECRFVPSVPALPKTMYLTKVGITRFKDGSGVHHNCPVWRKTT